MARSSRATRRRPPELWLTFAIKVAGMVIAVHAAFTTRDPAAFGIAAFMLTGAQGAEDAIKSVRGR
jgi:hypothetical protein